MNFRLRLFLLNLVDAVLLNAAVLSALALRFDGDIPIRFLGSYARYAVFFTAGMLLLLNLGGVNRSLWRYAGVPTLLRLMRSLVIGFLIAFALNIIPQDRPFPMSVIILSGVLGTAYVLGSRLVWKIFRTSQRRGPRQRGRRILIVGAGDVGAMIGRELLRSDRASGEPVGYVDDDPRKVGRRIESLEVLGTTFDIPRLIQEKNVGEVLIAAPSAPAHLIRQVVQVCQQALIECRTLPALPDFISGRGALGQVREVRIEDLLGREPVTIDIDHIASRVGGRTVLVTGAGGSIGSELCRQLAFFHPGRLVTLDHCENRLCYLGLDLAESFPDVSVVQVVGDIRDEPGLEALFSTHRPEIVFHAAAHKHVNFLETAPREAIINNLGGTRNLARAAQTHGVETFVFISTDKAVNPTNVMGASKRACEMLLQAMPKSSGTKFVAVRFGNVLGSDGSVIPIFRRQLAKGGPLTVTHPDARRFFMTIPEASRLVIQAALLGEGGEVFVLDMGEQMRILDVAEQLIRLSGLRPGIDVPIRFVGLRPGEKLEEELLTDSERRRVTVHSKIFRWELDAVDPERVEGEAENLIRLAQRSQPDEIREALLRFVPEYERQEVVPLPVTGSAPQPVRSVPVACPQVQRREPALKRVLDVALSLALLAGLAVPVGLVLLLYLVSGAGRVRFVREEVVGRNRRIQARRRAEAPPPIDRRDRDRRVRPLPGNPFVAYRIELQRSSSRNRLQVGLGSLLQRLGCDRILWLWNIVRGEMSLVGPSARLAEQASFSQDYLTAWIFATRPGLVVPGSLLHLHGDKKPQLAQQYDVHYARFGGMRLDLEALLRAVGQVLWGRSRVGRDTGEEEAFSDRDSLILREEESS